MRRLAAALLLCVAALPAFAHNVEGAGGFVAGLAHPVFGPDHVVALTSRAVLAGVLRLQERLPEAKQELEYVIPRLREAVGEGHTWTLSAKNDLGGLLWQQGKMGAARAELEEAIVFLAPRMKGLHPAAPAELGGVEGIYGIESLPLAWSQV